MIVRLYCPGAAELLVVSVNVLYAVAGFGDHDAVQRRWAGRRQTGSRFR